MVQPPFDVSYLTEKFDRVWNQNGWIIHKIPTQIARNPPVNVNHFRNTCLSFTTALKATTPRIKANKIMVKIVPVAKAVI